MKKENGKVCFIGEKYEVVDNLYNSPKSSLFNIHVAKKSGPGQNMLWYTDDVYRKVWRVPCRAGVIVIPLASMNDGSLLAQKAENLQGIIYLLYLYLFISRYNLLKFKTFQ